MAGNFRGASTLLLLLLQATFVATLHAQQPPGSPGPLRLTLKEAVQLALKQNPQQIIAKLLVRESEHNAQVARSSLLPQAGITAEGSLDQYNLQTVERLPHRTPAGPYQYIDAGVGYSQTLLDLPQIRGYQIGREGRKEARADEQTTHEIVVTAVVEQYLMVLRALATRDAANARVVLAQRLYEQAKQLQRTGIGLNIDTVSANVELQNEQQNLIDAEAQTRTTTYALAELLDLPRDQELEVTDHLEFYNLPAIAREALLDQALTYRPEVRSVDSQQRIAKLSTDATREQASSANRIYWLLGLSGRAFQQRHSRIHVHHLFGVSAFHRWPDPRQLANAKLEQQHVDENRRHLKDRIVREVKTAFEDLNAARERGGRGEPGLQIGPGRSSPGAAALSSRRHNQRGSGHRARCLSPRQRQSNRRTLSIQPVPRSTGSRHRPDRIDVQQIR